MNTKIIAIISSILLLGGLGLAVYFGFIRPNTKPNPTETQQADAITNHNYTYDFHPMFGCMRIPVKEEK